MTNTPTPTNPDLTLKHDNDDENPLLTSPYYTWPPFFTLQPNLETRASQLSDWAALILAHHAHTRTSLLVLSTALGAAPFANGALGRRLSEPDARVVLSAMAAVGRVEWLNGEGGGAGSGGNGGSGSGGGPGIGIATGMGLGNGVREDQYQQQQRAIVWWRRPEEWAGEVEMWVADGGRRGVVMTVYELLEGEETRSCSWRGMEREVFRKVLDISVKRGKAALFGVEGEEGVKFF